MSRKSAPLAWRNSKEHYKIAGSEDLKKVTGVIDSFTIVHSASKEFDAHVPYVIALISLNNGKKIVSQLVDCRKPESA